MKSLLMRFIILCFILTALPLIGALCFEIQDISFYIKFPPEINSGYSSFNIYIFLIFMGFIMAVLSPFIIQGLRCLRAFNFVWPGLPWWGNISLVFLIAFWVLSWTRFSWFAKFQLHTFPLLWISFIIFINSISYSRKGDSLLWGKPFFFFILFPVSALFWWFFEYLNRFVLNWYYINIESFNSFDYIIYASICFSTVLPGVLSVEELLGTFSFFKKAYGSFFRLKLRFPRILAMATLVLSMVSLFFMGVFPEFLFPLVWVSPLVIILSIKSLKREAHIFSPLAKGDWSRVVRFALASLVCGFFWEMWNFYSLAKWEYSIPFVHGLRLFEMPLPGYGGYLPFGLECAVIGDILYKYFGDPAEAG